jgi:hypothetical protein
MLADTLKRSAEGIHEYPAEIRRDAISPAQPRVNTEQVIIILDDSDTDSPTEYARVATPPNDPPTSQTVTNKIETIVEPTNLPPTNIPAPDPFHSNTNMYFTVANNTAQTNFDPEIFDMQLTAQGGYKKIAVLHGFTTKRTHKQAAKRRI